MGNRVVLTLSLILSWSLAGAEGRGVNFDQGVDASTILGEARRLAAEDKAPVESAQVGGTRYERDCVRFTFSAEDSSRSDSVWLRSQEWVQECRHDPRGQWRCWERPGITYHERARITLQDRKPLYPWEYDSFVVCLQGPWLDIYERETAYEYKLLDGGRRNGDFVLTPVKKIAMAPDEDGLSVDSWTSTLTLGLKDKWASHYAGERTYLKLTLKKQVPNWFDETVGEIELTLPAAAGYQVHLLDHAAKFSQRPEPGKNYYVKYAFKRVGKISKPDLVSGGETGKVAYRPVTLAMGR